MTALDLPIDATEVDDEQLFRHHAVTAAAYLHSLEKDSTNGELIAVVAQVHATLAVAYSNIVKDRRPGPQ